MISRDVLVGVATVAAVLLLGAVLWNATSAGRAVNLDIQGPNGAVVSLTVPGERVEFTAVLERLFANEFDRGAVEAWLRTHHNMISLDDPELASAIAATACDSLNWETGAPLTEILEAMQHCADDGKNRDLRKLVVDRERPFHPVARRWKASVPDPASEPDSGEVYVCAEEYYPGRPFSLMNPERSDYGLIVRARGLIACSEVPLVRTNLHLNRSDARRLFGGERVEGIQEVIVTPVTTEKLSYLDF